MIYVVTASFILLDLITGFIKAFKEKNFSSTTMRQGLFHKAGSIAVIVFGVLIDYAQGYVDIGVSIPIASILCSFIITMEMGSIFENVCIINPEIVPKKLQQYFEKLSDVKEREEKSKAVDSPEEEKKVK